MMRRALRFTLVEKFLNVPGSEMCPMALSKSFTITQSIRFSIRNVSTTRMRTVSVSASPVSVKGAL